MAGNGRGAIAPQLTSAELESLREFWDVYESPFARIGSEIADDVGDHPEPVLELRNCRRSRGPGTRPPRRHLHEVPEPRGRKAHVRLLVADDDRRVRMLVRAQMAGTEIDVLEAADGHHALLRVSFEDPDAVLLDWRMPGGGPPLVRALVNEHRLGGPRDHALEHRRPTGPPGGAARRRRPLPTSRGKSDGGVRGLFRPV